MYMYHRFLIHSSADGHLGCFHVLAIINSAAMNLTLQLPFYWLFYVNFCGCSYSRSIFLYVTCRWLVVVSWRAVFRRILRVSINSAWKYQMYLSQRKSWEFSMFIFRTGSFFHLSLYSPTPCAVSGPIYCHK